MLAVSRLFVVFQFYWIAKMSMKIVFKESELERTFIGFSLTTITFLINIGTWPIMAWHTLDGIFVGVTALAIAKTNIEKTQNRILYWIIPLLLAGVAPLIKQGFAVVPVLMLSLIIVARIKNLIPWAGLTLLPGVLFLIATIQTPGGLLGQLHSGSKRELLEPVNTFVNGMKSGGFITLTTALVVFLFGSLMISKRSPKLALLGSILSIVIAVLISVLQDFSMFNFWADCFVLIVFVLLVTFCRDLIEFFLHGSMIALAFAASLSWGVPNPSLLGGSILLAAVSLAHSLNLKSSVFKPIPSSVLCAVLAVVVIFTSWFMFQSRSRNTYSEPPRELLTSSVDMPQFKFIQMSRNTAEYLNSIQFCLSQYPAETIVVLPDGPGLYPLFNNVNPFDSDWWLGAERAPDKERRDLVTVQELNNRDNWLVLVQSYFVFDLARISNEEVNLKRDMFFHDAVDARVFDSLDGELISCNSFTGKYRPDGN
jgi:Zn-dependent protease with chaperone function